MSNSKVLQTLNKLAPFYSSGLGFHPMSKNSNYAETYLPDSLDPETFYWFIAQGANIIYEGNNIRTAEEFNQLLERDQYLEDVEVQMPLTVCNLLAETPVTYDKVIIKYQEDTWYSKPGRWYNKQQDNPGLLDHLRPYILPCLTTRPYIKVKQHMMKVEISAGDKGSPIIIGDILFATRALASDGTRTADYYTIVKKFLTKNSNKKVLVLEPEMDNFST